MINKEKELVYDFCETWNLDQEPNNAQEDLTLLLNKYKIELIEELEKQIQDIDPMDFDMFSLYRILDNFKK